MRELPLPPLDMPLYKVGSLWLIWASLERILILFSWGYCSGWCQARPTQKQSHNGKSSLKVPRWILTAQSDNPLSQETDEAKSNLSLNQVLTFEYIAFQCWPKKVKKTNDSMSCTSPHGWMWDSAHLLNKWTHKKELRWMIILGCVYSCEPQAACTPWFVDRLKWGWLVEQRPALDLHMVLNHGDSCLPPPLPTSLRHRSSSTEAPHGLLSSR